MATTPTAQTDNKMGMMSALAALFGGKGAAAPQQPLSEPMPGSMGMPSEQSAQPQAKDTVADSAAPAAPGMMGSQEGQGLVGALHDLIRFFQAKPASASNDNKYQKALTDAGIPASETGVGM